MPSSRKLHKGSGFTGHPALIFWFMNDYGGQTWMGNLMILDKWHAQLNSYLYAKLGKDLYESDYSADLKEIMDLITDAWGIYKPSYEGLDYFDPGELTFAQDCRGIYHRLTSVTTRSHICDEVEYDRNESPEVE